MKISLFSIVAALLLAGCGSGDSTSPTDEAALKAKLDKPMGATTDHPKPANTHVPKTAGAPP